MTVLEQIAWMLAGVNFTLCGIVAYWDITARLANREADSYARGYRDGVNFTREARSET